MKKIIYTGAFRFPTGDAAAQRVLNNAKIFRELGYEVEFISWGGKSDVCPHTGINTYQDFKYSISNDLDIKIQNPLSRIINYLTYGKHAFAEIKRVIKDSDTIILYNPSLYFTYKMLYLSKRKKINLVLDLTEWYNPNEFPGGKLGPFYWLNEFNFRVIQRKVKNKILISNFLNNYYKFSNNIVLPPLTDVHDPKWNQYKSILEAYDGLRLIYAGTPGKKDCLENILEAVLKCLDRGAKIEFLVLGVTLDNIKFYKNFNRIIFYSSNIKLMGRVDQEDVPTYYNMSDFSILVRENNKKNNAGFPTKLAESLTSGCPSIVNYTSDIESYVSDNVNGIVIQDNSVEEIEIALNRALLLDVNAKKIMKNTCKLKALQQFHYMMYLSNVLEFSKKF